MADIVDTREFTRFAIIREARRECTRYTATHYFPEVPPGTIYRGYRCENLESQTFDDESFDLVLTQDVMEHVLDPAAAFREIGRTLRPGGMHVFTTPIHDLAVSRVRARHSGVGIEYLAERQYHGNPIDAKGALVTIDYGRDIADLILRSSGLHSTIYRTSDAERGLLGEFLEVVVSQKAAR
jgi:SAM-dependent methyltransferase